MMQIAAYGRLGANPKSIQTKTGKAMAVASIAVNLADREGDEHTEWISIIAFGRVADSLLCSSKGELISISGRAQVDSYTNGCGETQTKLQVIADSVISAKSVRPGGKGQSCINPPDPPPDDNCSRRLCFYTINTVSTLHSGMLGRNQIRPVGDTSLFQIITGHPPERMMTVS